MLIGSLPFLVLLLGLVIWFVSSRPARPWAEIGKIMFAVGLFFAVWRAADIVKLF